MSYDTDGTPASKPGVPSAELSVPQKSALRTGCEQFSISYFKKEHQAYENIDYVATVVNERLRTR
jgi:hypothetical protein